MKKTVLFAGVIMAVTTPLFLALAMPALACSPSDIKIKQADWQPPSASGLVRVVGELTNTCDEAIDAQLHFVFRDAAGKVTGADDEWVSTVNIAPHSDYAFSALPRGGFGFKTMTVTVQDVRHLPGN